jgi:8-oxo-dGTP diphosphatase
MGEISKTILTNLCMLYDQKGHYLVQNRLKKDWPGLNFPGGHVERYESLEESVVREMKEETGLLVSALEQCGVYEWNVPEENIRHVAVLYRSCHYEGQLVSSSEGPMAWLDEDEIASRPQSVDFDRLFQIMKRGL